MRKNKIFAALLTVSMLLCLLPAGVFASEEKIEISTSSELIALADKCRLDSWSVGKTVVLVADIDLSGTNFEPIPTFGGRFEGNGHTVSGLNLTSGGSAVGGLFRYIQKDGVVREVNVEGCVAPEKNAECFGGIAGENSGKIINCSFSGSVSGQSDIGGITGLNTASGELYGCRSLAVVSGEHYTGGIAGRNLGSIISCTNLGAVNTTNPEVEGEILDIDWSDLNSTENASVHTDTGGITGYSQGVLEQCVNRGNVGYPHVGYNVGGIAGRQSGYTNSCRNFGLVNGRKDVGGVVGQMVPSIKLQFSSVGLDSLRAEMDTLQGLLDTMITDFQDSSAEINGILNEAGNYIESAGKSASAIGDALVEFVDSNMESINSLSATAASYIQRLGIIAGHVEDCFSQLSDAGAYLAEFIAAMEGVQENTAVLGYAKYAVEKLDEASNAVSNAETLCLEAQAVVATALEQGADTEEMKAALETASGKLREAATELGNVKTYVVDAMENGIKPAMTELETLVEKTEELSAPLEKASSAFAGASDSMSKAFSGLESWLSDLGNEKPVEFKGFDKDFSEVAGRLDAAMVGLGGEMEKLNTAMNGAGQTMGEDLRKVNDQFFRVMDCFMNLLEGTTSETTVYEDMSEDELFATRDGKVESCENRGEVAGDVNVGGLAGTMAIEYDLDPEEDISVSGSSGGSFRYLTNAALMNGVNVSSVTAKKDAVGGAVGYMDLGVVYGCENYGNIGSLSGDYVGGIAGQSAAAVRNCWCLCSLSGRDYVGGIAGSVTDISGCRTIVELSASGGWKGSIAGEVLGEAKENYFVGEAQGGIDGVSYAGKAQPQEYADFVLSEGLPDEFMDFKLTFATEHITVKSVSFRYGGSIDFNDIPEVPERVGYVGEWEDFDFNHLTFSSTVDAVYTPYDKVVAVNQQVGKRPVVLLEGAFLPGSIPTIESCAAAPTGSVEAWTVAALGSVEPGYTVRYLVPADSQSVEIYVLHGDSWVKTETRTESSYLLFEAGGDSVSFAAVEPEKEFPLVPLLLTVAGGALLALLALILRAHTGRKYPAARK